MYEIDTSRVRSPLENPKWDLKHTKNGTYNGRRVEQVDLEDLQSVIKLKPPPKKTWEPDVKAMISTKKWLGTHGLKRNRLSLNQILPAIGFKHSDDFDRSLKKPICSRYGEGMFSRYPKKDGKVYNITVSKERLKQIENSLLQAIVLYKRRLEWLTTESRRLFGVIEEHCITIVLDIKTNNPSMFDHCRNAMVRLLDEQIGQIAKFNLIRAGQDMVMFQDAAVPVCRESLDKAINWIFSLDHAAASTKTCATEAVFKAMSDKNIEAVYLFSEGGSTESARELLKEKVKNGSMPVNTVAFNSTDSVTIQFLKDVSRITGGRFHAFAFTKLDSDVYGTSAYNSDQKLLHGGVPPGAGMRDDVVKLWEELEEARNTLSEIQLLSEDAVEGKGESAGMNDSETRDVFRGDQYLTSKEWLSKHGLDAKKLGFFDVLAGVAFKHCDGVVDVKRPPDEEVTDASSRNKLINAQYCDKFCHVLWKDGTVKHVHVTADVHRNYERRMAVALDALQKRIDWLQQGSRELFGTIIEDQVYILIDVSNSMEPHLDLVKEKLIRLMEEQLRHKMKFNLIKFGTRAMTWRDRMVDVNEANLHSAWSWVRGLTVTGSTNTLSALKLALSDPNTQAVYLLTDGRPDMPQKTVLAQVQLQQKVPIHTISFNCADTEANQFLAQLAADTGGRYHYFSEQGTRDPGGPMPFESEDIRFLKEELDRGREDLSKIARLRAECAALDWTNNRHVEFGCSRDHGLPPRPASAPGMRMDSPKPPITPRTTRPMSAFGTAELTTHIKCHSYRAGTFPRKNSVTKGKPKLVAGHTKTSLMRTMSSTSFDPSKQWMLPETRELFEKQWSKFKQALEETEKIDRLEKIKKQKKRTLRIKDKDPYEMTSRRWLKIYGLRARKLTIMDALSPTAIPHRAKYVPILDKYVLSKVFDEVLPLAHTTGSNRKEVKLINPHGVNLVGYEERLQDAINDYNKRLDMIVWKALTDEERDKFGSENSGPVSFMDNKLELMQALDRLGWPLREDDILLLQEEIEQAYKYLQQSKDLRRAAERKSSLSSIGTDNNRPKSGKKIRRKKIKKRYTQNDDYYDDIEDDIIDDGDDGDDVFDEKSTAREYEGLGSSISETSSSKKPPTSRKRIQKILDKRKGMSVVGRSESDGLYYPGIVTQCPDARHVEVSFRDLAVEIIPSRFVIPIGGAQPCPGLRVGDYVLVKTTDDDIECWVPAIVQHTPEDRNRQAKYFTVLKYNNRKCTALRSELLKITKSRFSFALRFILELKKEQYQREIITASYDENRRGRKHHRRHRKHRHKHRRRRRDEDSDKDEDEIAKVTGRYSSSERSRSRSKSGGSHSRSRSRSRSRSTSRSRSRSPDSRGGAQAPTPTPRSFRKSSSRSRSRSKSPSRSRSKSPSRSRSQSPSRSRSPPKRDRSKSPHRDEVFLSEHHKKLEELQRKLEEQQESQLKAQEDLRIQQENLVDAARQLYDAKIGELQNTQAALLNEQEKLQRQQRELIEKQEQQMRESTFVRRDETDGERREVSPKSTPRASRKLKEGEEVLARWSDDGWYYRGTVASIVDENTYLISDSVGDLEQIQRNDIFTDGDDSDNIIKPNDPVIALHPSYSFSYSPGVVLNIYPDLWTHIRYYDGEEAKVPREEVYKTTADKFEDDVRFILQCEDSWVGQAVVARNDTDGKYYLGQVKERVGNGRQYIVEWADGSLQIQNSSCIFGAFTKRHRLALGDKVLAIINSQSLVYLPGVITSVNGNELVVKFCDGRSSSHVDPKQCFWLSQDYYDSAVSFYQHRQDYSSEGSTDSSR
uniref:von Willebrand factor A domain-containing protein 3B-like n=1 Tax=Saccoglossus kowalevskii TaxID=10224 RepID=A0ABM0ME76_SACKO|nr:PREDICTED: von Willebrand factor A domain-containing protein 3B-like [Saccoglossus kowalevskii]